MKIGIFIDNFYLTQAQKDPGIIGVFLAKKQEVIFYCFETDIESYRGLKIKKISKTQARNSRFWIKENNEFIIFYSWLSLKFSSIIRALSKTTSKLILKMDSDGHLIFPLRPTYLKTGPKNYTLKLSALFIFRIIQWFIFPKIISRKKIKQIKNCAALIIESPLALNNLQKSLKYWNLENLNDKLFFIPNPINPPKNLETIKKENIIISIGRWDDKRKNGSGLVKALSGPEYFPDWNFILVGNGSNRLKEKIKAENKQINISAFEYIEHDELIKVLQKAKICFAPSICESFGIAAAESLSVGASLAGTPLESFKYLINDKFGTLADDFSEKKIKKALIEDIEKWERNAYNPAEIKNYISLNLDPEKIISEIEKVMEKI